MVLVPLYDTLGPDTCTFIINQGEFPFIINLGEFPFIINHCVTQTMFCVPQPPSSRLCSVFLSLCHTGWVLCSTASVSRLCSVFHSFHHPVSVLCSPASVTRLCSVFHSLHHSGCVLCSSASVTQSVFRVPQPLSPGCVLCCTAPVTQAVFCVPQPLSPGCVLCSTANIELVLCDERSRVMKLLRNKAETPNLKTVVCFHCVSSAVKYLTKKAQISVITFDQLEVNNCGNA